MNWRGIAFLLPVVLAPSVGSLAALWLWPGQLGPLVYVLCKAVLYGLPTVVATRTLRWSDLRRGVKSGTAGLPWALLGGAAVCGLTAGARAIGVFEEVDVSRLLQVTKTNGFDQAGRYWTFAAWLCIGNSALEEFAFRWFVDSRLRALGLRTATVLVMSATIFTAHHVIVLAAYFDLPMVLAGASGVFLGGLLWSWSLKHWKSLLPGWCMHALVDLAIVWLGASLIGLGV